MGGGSRFCTRARSLRSAGPHLAGHAIAHVQVTPMYGTLQLRSRLLGDGESAWGSGEASPPAGRGVSFFFSLVPLRHRRLLIPDLCTYEYSMMFHVYSTNK